MQAKVNGKEIENISKLMKYSLSYAKLRKMDFHYIMNWGNNLSPILTPPEMGELLTGRISNG